MVLSLLKHSALPAWITGQPVDPGNGADQCGTADQFVIDENICASFFIAKFWGLAH